METCASGECRERGDGRGMPEALAAFQLRCEGASDRLEAALSVAVSSGAGVSDGESHRCSYTACEYIIRTSAFTCWSLV